MPPSNRPPEQQPRVKSFDPLVLDRTVIALPLLKAMKEDFDHIKAILAVHPEAEREDNTAILYNGDFPGGTEAARRLVEEMAARAAAKALEVANRLLADASEETRERAKTRRQALEEAISVQRIGPLMPDGPYGVATLHASVVRRILNENERLASSDPESAPISLLGPTRFEMIIDLNLEHPRGREAARKWVLDHIEPAKQRPTSAMRARASIGRRTIPTASICSPGWRGGRSNDGGARVLRRKPPRNRAGRRRRKPSLKAKIDRTRYRAIFHIWPDFESRRASTSRSRRSRPTPRKTRSRPMAAASRGR